VQPLIRNNENGFRKQRRLHPQHCRSALARISKSLWRSVVEASGDAGDRGLATLDYRISMYQPMAHVARHQHQVQEQIYHVLEGEGLMEIAGKNHVVRKHDFIFLPPGVEHAISNSGLVDLVFLVITSPVTDDSPG
jgi:mannose-6-phosphate isomerase-like protein (cupin superfamily)